MIYLRSLALERSPDTPIVYPFTVPAVASLDRLELVTPVTFFAGENGTGKSTLLEAIAAGVGSISVRGGDGQTERALAHVADLASALRFDWNRRTHQGFFLRAEDFFDYCKRMAALVGELGEFAQDFEGRLEGQALHLARGAVLGQQRAVVERYGEDLNTRSHGESFLQFFAARFTGPGLYLLDEPDTALSAQSVLALLSMLKQMTEDGSQFIIATHSPLLLAFPGATIFSFDVSPIAAVAYDEVEQVTLMRRFLAAPEAFVRRL